MSAQLASFDGNKALGSGIPPKSVAKSDPSDGEGSLQPQSDAGVPQDILADPMMLTVQVVDVDIDVAAMERPERPDEIPPSFNPPSEPEACPKPTPQPASTAPNEETKPEPKDEPLEVDQQNAEEKAKAEAEVLNSEGNALYRERKFDEAIERYRRAWALYPGDVRFLANLSEVHLKKGEYEETIAIAEQVVREGRDLRPDSKIMAKTFGRIGSAHDNLGNLTAAIEFYRKSLTEHRLPDVRAKLDEAEKAKAKADLQAATTTSPSSPELRTATPARQRHRHVSTSSDQPGPVRKPIDLDVAPGGTRRRTRTSSIDIPVRIARASFCRSICTLPDAGSHLVIDYKEVKLNGDAGVAISYTWGEFDRRKIVIGHGIQGAGNPISLELGLEWNITDLQNCLVNLSEKHNGIWMDQLCIRQREKEVALALASIPAIYRGLDTIALMPGAICGCLETLANRLIDLESQGSTDAELQEKCVKTGESELSHCLNSLGLNSYFDRLWTLQEVMYSKRISVLRTSQTTARCVKRIEDVGYLESFARLRYQREMDKGSPSDGAFQAAVTANLAFHLHGKDMMGAYNAGTLLACNCKTTCTCRTEYAGITILRFLRGDTIENPRWRRYELEPDEDTRLTCFLNDLYSLGTSVRKTSQLQDYVRAVWADCPGYELPEGYKNMSLPALLEDAIVQLERHFGMGLATNAPAGLFGDREAGALWRPTTYLQESDVFEVRSVYGVVSASREILRAVKQYLMGGAIPLVSRVRNGRSMPTHSAPSRQVFGGSNAWKVFTEFKPVLDQFSSETKSRVSKEIYFNRPKSITERFASPLTQLDEWPEDFLDEVVWNEDVFKHFLYPFSLSYLAPIYPILSQWKSDPKTNYHDIVYLVVTSALGLPFHACKRAGLELVSQKDPPCVGLFKSGALNERHRSSVTGRRYTTTCVADRHSEGHFADSPGDGCVLLETAYIEVGPPDVLEVVGIWVPMHNGRDFVQWQIERDWSNKRAGISKRVGILGGDRFSRRALMEKW